MRGAQIEDPSHRPAPKYESYRALSNMRASEHMVPTPIGAHGALTSVRNGSGIGAQKQNGPHNGSNSNATGAGTGTFRRGGTMTKGTGKSKRSGMHALAWMPSVTVGEKKDSSGADSLTSSRISLAPSSRLGTKDRGSESPQIYPSNGSEVFDFETPPSWAEEYVILMQSSANVLIVDPRGKTYFCCQWSFFLQNIQNFSRKSGLCCGL